MRKKKREMIELDEKYAVVCIPADTIELRLTARILLQGKVKEVSKDLTMHDVRKAMREAEDWYIPEDEKHTFTEAGKQLIEDLDREQKELCKQ